VKFGLDFSRLSRSRFEMEQHIEQRANDWRSADFRADLGWLNLSDNLSNARSLYFFKKKRK